MKILNLVQGSEEWLAVRDAHLCASDAPAMMNASKYKSRNELLREKSGGCGREISNAEQALFDRGHETEAAIRPHIEAMIKDELFPATVVDDDDRLLASLDGVTMAGDTLMEHKLWNEELAAAVQSGDIGPHYYWQMEQQLLVAEAERVIFVVSDGTPDKCVHMEYRPVEGRRGQLLAGWKQFEEDLANYQHVEVLPAAVAEPVTALPSVSVQVNGSLSITSNLAVFGEKLKEFVSGIDKNPSDDQAFANCEAAIKTLKKAEEALDAAEASALAQVVCIDEMVIMKQSLHELSRSNRLTLEKIVKTRKETIRVEIRQSAEKAFLDHCDVINKRLGKVQLPVIKTAFAEVMKGKKTVSSLRDAVDAELARVKIEANSIGEKIDENLRSLKELAADHAYLFMDAQQIVLKENADLVNLIKLRIAEHEASEKKRLEDEREKIRQEEEAKATAKAKAEMEAQKTVDPAPTAKATETVTEAPPPVITQVKPKTGMKTRPTDAEIIEVLALHYRVHESKVIAWLIDMDLETESNKLMEAM